MIKDMRITKDMAIEALQEYFDESVLESGAQQKIANFSIVYEGADEFVKIVFAEGLAAAEES